MMFAVEEYLDVLVAWLGILGKIGILLGVLAAFGVVIGVVAHILDSGPTRVDRTPKR